MHKINVLALGSENFNTSLEELKDHFNFKLTTTNENFDIKTFEKYDVLFCHQDFINEKRDFFNNLKSLNKIIILALSSKSKKANFFNEKISLPAKVSDINLLVEKSFAKKNFSLNSSIKIKDYTLDKNEKKLSIKEKFIFLTEKEIQLLDLFLNQTGPVNKEMILDKVWKYSENADTHTVETHIYID